MDELRVGNTMVVGDVTLVPIARFSIQSDTDTTERWLWGLKEPFAIIVCDAAGIRAYGIESIEIPVESLIQKIPDLDAVLGPLSH